MALKNVLTKISECYSSHCKIRTIYFWHNPVDCILNTYLTAIKSRPIWLAFGISHFFLLSNQWYQKSKWLPSHPQPLSEPIPSLRKRLKGRTVSSIPQRESAMQAIFMKLYRNYLSSDLFVPISLNRQILHVLR